MIKSHEHKYHYLYKITNNINSKFYIGVHNTDDLNDGYMGSGSAIKKAIKKYGISNFTKEYLMFFDNAEEAFLKEKEIVTKELVNSKNCYNEHVGGLGKEHIGEIMVLNENDERVFISIDDSNYILGKYKPITSGWINTRDKEGNVIRVRYDDPRYLSGELIHNTKGYAVVRDENGNAFQISVLNPDYINGKYKSVNKGYVVVNDDSGKTHRVSIDDPNYINGKYKSINKGMYMMKDRDGNVIRIDKNDERLKTGELVGLTKGYLTVKDKNGNKIKVKKGDPRFKTGELNGHRKNLVTVIDEKGNKLTVRNDDPLFLNGTYKALYKGHRWINKDGIYKHVSQDEIEKYLNDGWKLGGKKLK